MRNLLLFALWLSLCAVESWAQSPPQSVDPPKIPELKISDVEPRELTPEDYEPIERLAKGILKLRTPRFFACGEELVGPAKAVRAYDLAELTFDAAEAAGVNPWGLAGTIENESGWDPCAISKGARDWAIKKELLRSKKLTISHSFMGVLNVVISLARREAWDGKFDLGPCQIRFKHYRGPVASLLTAHPGIDICAREMAARAAKHETKTPWLYWPGKRSERYAKRVRMWALKLGARKDEI